MIMLEFTMHLKERGNKRFFFPYLVYSKKKKKEKSLTPRRGVSEIIIEFYCEVNINIFRSLLKWENYKDRNPVLKRQTF